jgi:hypothetical protein
MVCFQTKNPNLGKFWRALDWKILIYIMPIWNILQIFVIFYNHLVHFMFIWYIFPVFVSCTKKNLATQLASGGMFDRSARFIFALVGQNFTFLFWIIMYIATGNCMGRGCVLNWHCLSCDLIITNKVTGSIFDHL